MWLYKYICNVLIFICSFYSFAEASVFCFLFLQKNVNYNQMTWLSQNLLSHPVVCLSTEKI